MTCTKPHLTFEGHPVPHTFLYVPSSGLASASCTCILMPMAWKKIEFQPSSMAPNGSCKGKGEETASAKMLTLAINRPLSFDWTSMQVFILEHIRAFRHIYSIVVTLLRRHGTSILRYSFWMQSRHTPAPKFNQFSHTVGAGVTVFVCCGPHFCAYIEQTFDKTHDQINSW